MEKGVEFFDRYAAKWDATRDTYPSRLRFLLDLAALPLGGRVLDAGSGTGVLLPYLVEALGPQGHITAVDFSSQMLALAKAKFGDYAAIDFRCGDILQLEFPPASYDAVICLNFFPHLTTLVQKQAYIARAYAALRPGGKILILHDISRDAVNGVHSQCEETLNDRLPSGIDVSALLRAAGFIDAVGLEDDELYFVRGIKK